jgi:hypothetical protein
MAYELKANRGSLFRNTEKDGEGDRDYAGAINIGGTEYWISGWIKEGKKGKYMSLAVKPKVAKPDRTKSLSQELNDSMPF